MKMAGGGWWYGMTSFIESAKDKLVRNKVRRYAGKALQYSWKTQKMGKTEECGTLFVNEILPIPIWIPSARWLCHSSQYEVKAVFPPLDFGLLFMRFFGRQGNSNCDTSKGVKHLRWGLPSVARITSQTTWASAEDTIPTQPSQPLRWDPGVGWGHPRPSRPGQAFQTTRTTHSLQKYKE